MKAGSMGVLGFFFLCQMHVVSSLHTGAKPVTNKTVTDQGECPFDQKCGENCLGTKYGGRPLTMETLEYIQSLEPTRTTVWSFGVGGDASFEIALACKYKFHVHLFDPSPAVPKHMDAVKTLIGRKNLSAWDGKMPEHSKCPSCKTYWADVANSNADAKQLDYHPIAISNNEGNLTFYGAEHMDDTSSWSLDKSLRPEGVRTVKVPAKTLRTLMHDLHTTKIDILKIDVEGLETLVLEQVLKLPDKAMPKLIFADMDCGGNHDKCANQEEKDKNEQVILDLEERGYKLIKQGKHSPDVSFYKPA